MSNLGSVGSSSVAPEATPTSQPVAVDTSSNLHEQSLQQAGALFQSPNPNDQLTGLKMLLVMMSKGHNVSEFSPFVVQMVASQDPTARQLAYVFLNHYADEAPESIVLSINTFQRSLTDSDPLCRALAIKVMSSIRSREVLPAIQDSVIQVIGDPSPYVKKAAAFAMIKAAGLAEDESETIAYLPHLQRLLGDPSPIAFSGAIAAYWALCPDNVEFIHPHFRHICQTMPKLDSWAQVLALRSLTVYSRLCFKNPSSGVEEENPTAFWDDSNQKESLSSDHILLIQVAKKLLMSPNASVVLAAASLLYYCAPNTHMAAVARPLVRLLYDTPVIAQIALNSIITIVSVHNHIFIPHMNHFFIRRNDIPAVKKLKLRVLSLLASPANAEMILNELSIYTGSSDVEFAASAVKTMGKTALVNEAIIPYCLVSLLRLMGRADGIVLSEVVIVIAHILRRRRGTDDEAHALKQLCRKFIVIKEPSARAAVLSIVGDMHETHTEFAPQLLRYIAKNFKEEPGEVRLQSLTLAAKLCSLNCESEIPIYLLKLGERDSEFDVRDRARFLLALIETQSEIISSRLKSLLFPERKAPTWSAAENYGHEYQIGTLSHYFNKEMLNYEPLPDWAPEDEIPDESVRMASRKEGVISTENTNENKEVAELSDFFSGDEKSNNDKCYYSEEYDVYEEEEQKDVNEDDFFN